MSSPAHTSPSRAWLPSFAIPRRYGRVLMLAWGIVVALYSISANDTAIPDQARLMGMREQGVREAIQALDDGGPPLAAYLEPGTYDVLPRGDDPGLYLYLPLVGHVLGVDDPLLLIKWTFVALFAVLFLVYPLIFYGLFGSLLAGAVAPLVVLWQFGFVRDTDIYWVAAWAILLCFPLLFLLARRPWSPGKVAALAGVMVVASFATSIRGLSGVGALLAALGLALTARRSWRYRLGVAGLLIVAYLSVSSFALTGVRAYRDARIENTTSPPYLTTQWHSLYIGLGYVENPYGIRYDDGVAYEHALRVNPKVRYLGEGYGTILRDLYFDLVVNDPGFVAKNFVRKTAVVLDDTLRQFWFVVVLLPLLLLAAPGRRPFSRDLLLLVPGAAIAIAQPVLVMPYLQYELGWLALWGLLAVLSFSWLASLLPVAAGALAADPRTAAARALGPGGPVRRTLWRATSPWAWGGAAVTLIVIALLAGPLSPDRHKSAAFYRQGESPRLAQPAQADTLVEWRLGDGVPGDWQTGDGAEVRVTPGTGLSVRTNPAPSSYQLIGPVVVLEPGSYTAVVDGRISDGGLEVGILDSKSDRWLTTTHFWSDQRDPLGARGMIGAAFTLSERLPVRIILANWASGSSSSRWVVRSVRLVKPAA